MPLAIRYLKRFVVFGFVTLLGRCLQSRDLALLLNLLFSLAVISKPISKACVEVSDEGGERGGGVPHS
jgi:hypothetical protein